MNKKKKAFTLTELLVVVVVIGVLSAVVLPKFNKVIETRRTTEAEELMGAIRTEQEKRCALDKEYATDFNGLSEIVRSDNTKNYTLTLASTGVQAERREKYNYTLSIPSYADGRICCSGADCDKLNKNYPKCEDFTPEASPEACAGEVAETPAVYECMGSATQKCGCQDKGTQSRTCNTSTGEWSDWGACSVSDSCECTGEMPKERDICNSCGTRLRLITCDSTTGEWKTGSWGPCSKTELECRELLQPEEDPCMHVTAANWSECCAGKSPLEKSWCYRTCEKELDSGSSGSGDGELAKDPDPCNLTADPGCHWFQGSVYYSPDVEKRAHCSFGFENMHTHCNGFDYECRCSPLPPDSELKPTPVGGSGGLSDKVLKKIWYCAAYAECSETCPEYTLGY